ncbi:MAG: hypothetical protein A2V70_17740 [Planctomycetes bacterium RBG_13_63_9]|nr:MAG: hypothetical protein A2V70_17740 [Planctomycetes bacterium RBG_13_63_9]
MFFPFHDDNPTSRMPVITCALIGVNVVVFLWFWRLPEADQQEAVYRRGLVPIWISQLGDPKPIGVPVQGVVRHPRFRQAFLAQGWIPVNPPTRPQILLSLVTCMFLHGGWLHLIGNMWFLWIFGNNVEDRLGMVVYLVLYLAGGLLASGCHWATHMESIAPVIGASGAVAAVLGAYAITWPWARVHTVVVLIVFITIVDLPALLVLGMWFVIQLLEGTKEGVAQGVAWWAHIGGFLAGVALMPVFSAAVGADGKKEGGEEAAADFLE